MSDEARHLHSDAGGASQGHYPHARPGDPDPEIRVRVLTKIMLVLGAVMVLFAILMWPLARYFYRSQPEPSRAVERIDQSRPAGPLLQVDPTLELEELRRQEQRMLDSYGWVDRGAGIARVPIERALELVLAEGVGARVAPTGGAEAGAPAAPAATP